MLPRSPSLRRTSRALAGAVWTWAGVCGFATTTLTSPSAHADAVACLVNVTVRPGHHICDKVSLGRAYAQLIDDVKADFGTSNEYQASYLISQAVNERYPALIWQLRNSAAGYRPPPPLG